MSDKNELAYVETLSSREIAEHLEKLARGLRLGLLGIEGQGQQLTLRPSPVLKIELTAEESMGAGELKFEVSWKDSRSTESEKLLIVPGTDSMATGTKQTVGPPSDAPATV